eukprot:SAG31_NODE_374_length_16577_cov_9.902173_5_plen_90_part_00
MLVTDGGLGQLRGCDIYLNSMAGLEICYSGNPRVRNCTFRENGVGVYAHSAGRGSLEGCMFDRPDSVIIDAGATTSVSDMQSFARNEGT